MINIIYFCLIFLVGALLSSGLYQFALAAFKPPSASTTKTIKAITRRQKNLNTKEKNNDSALNFIAKFIRLNPYKRAILEEELKIADISKTPEVYYASAVLAFIKFAVLAIPFLFIFPIMSLVLFILAALKFAQERQKVNDRIEAKRKQIDMDLPRFVYAVINELKSSHDVLSIFERHKDGFSTEFSNEINITIADMRTGNYEAALQRFEGRIGSTNLSEVVRGLIETSKGVKTNVYWETLALRFSEMQKQALRKEAQKVPPKVRRLSFCLLICMMLMYGVVLAMQVINNISMLF